MLSFHKVHCIKQKHSWCQRRGCFKQILFNCINQLWHASSSSRLSLCCLLGLVCSNHCTLWGWSGRNRLPTCSLPSANCSCITSISHILVGKGSRWLRCRCRAAPGSSSLRLCPTHHLSHTAPQHLCLHLSCLQLLLSQFLFNVHTEWNRAFVLLTMFCMIATQSNELFANWTTTICFPLTAFCMCNHMLHLLTTWISAVSITTLACMHQRLNTSLN